MPETSRYTNERMTIRVGRGSLSFSMPDADGTVSFNPYVVKSGVSMAANLREAFKTADFLRQVPERAHVVVDGDVLMVPINLFEESMAQELFVHSFPDRRLDTVFYNVIAELKVVAISSVNKDLNTVLNDHFSSVTLLVAMSPVWRHMYRRAFTGINMKLYAYMHENRLDLFSFQQNRFVFSNSFDVKHTRDACYFILYVWNQLHFQAQKDELFLVGDLFTNDSPTNVEAREELLRQLRRFLKKVYVVNPSADFNRAQVTQIKSMPFDLQALFVKG